MASIALELSWYSYVMYRWSFYFNFEVNKYIPEVNQKEWLTGFPEAKVPQRSQRKSSLLCPGLALTEHEAVQRTLNGQN